MEPLTCGRVIVATREPHEQVVRDTIRDLGLDLAVILNKEAVMVLPIGTDKATGLRAALEELQLDAKDVAGVGDAENDLALLEACGLAVVVANALPSLKSRADIVLRGAAGAGVVELVDAILAGDSAIAKARTRKSRNV